MLFCKKKEKEGQAPDLVKEFLNEYYEGKSVEQALDGVLVCDVYTHFKEFCLDKGGKPLSVRKFSERICDDYDLTSENVKVVVEDKAQIRKRFVKEEE